MNVGNKKLAEEDDKLLEHSLTEGFCDWGMNRKKDFKLEHVCCERPCCTVAVSQKLL